MSKYTGKQIYSLRLRRTGPPTTKKDFFNAPAPDLTHTYAYNTRNELTADAMSRGGTYGYDYDNIGNRKTAQEGAESPTTAYTSNQLNQYTAIAEGTIPPFAPTYDADGNQTKLQTATGEWTVAYNALNQAVSFAQGSKRVECIYDYLNRRVEKAVYEGETLMSKKRYLYNGYLQIAELDAIHATEATELAEAVLAVLRKTYLWDPMEPIATRILAMSLFDETGAYQEDLYYTHDALKNTTALFGIKAGRRALYEYGPYGNTLKQEGDAAELNPFRFSSEYFDEETGLVQYNYRYYNTTDGRWVSRDLIPSGNPYNFSENSPSTGFDIIGLYKDSTVEWLKDNCALILLYSAQYKVDPFTVSMAMAEENDTYMKGIRYILDGVQDNFIEEYIMPGNGYFLSGDIGPVNIHLPTAVKYAQESSLGNKRDLFGVKSYTIKDVKDYIRTDEGAIEFSALIMSHVIKDIDQQQNGVVFPDGEIQKKQIYVNAFRQGTEDYLQKVQETKQNSNRYVTDPGVGNEELEKRYKQILKALCNCSHK